MKRKIIFLILTAALLAGCQKAPQVSAETSSATVTQTLPEETADSTGSPAEETAKAAETLPDPTEETVELSPAAYRVVYSYVIEDGKEYYDLQGIGPQGDILWQQQTTPMNCAQVQRVTAIGNDNGVFYYSEDGIVIALNAADGSILWQNMDFGGSFSNASASLIDPQGFLYLCGFSGPDLMVIDFQGNTIEKIPSLHEGYYGAYAIEIDGDQLLIHLSGNDLDEDEGDYPFRVDMSWIPEAEG